MSIGSQHASEVQTAAPSSAGSHDGPSTDHPASTATGSPRLTAGAGGMAKTATAASALAALGELSRRDAAVAGDASYLQGSATFAKLAAPRIAVEGWIKQAEANKRVPTVAIDLDGTIATHYEKYDASSIPSPRPGARKAVKEFQRRGWRIIIFTVRGNKDLVRDWLHEHDIPYDYINENPDQPADASGKVIADLYIDDRGVDAKVSWKKITETAIQRIEKNAELAAWQTVPQLVAQRYKEASAVQKRIAKIIKHLPVSDPGYGYVFWNPETKTVWAVLGDGDNEQTHQKWHNALKAVSGVSNVKTEAESGPHGDSEWVRIKTASALSWLGAPYRMAGKLTGGPSPLSNTIVNTLLGAGAGYGLGFLAENVLPEEYVERGKLRRNLAMLGGGAGVIPGAIQAVTNNSISRTAGKPLGASAIWKPDSQVPMSPHELNWKKSLNDGTMEKRFADAMQQLPAAHPMLQQATEEFVKQAYGAAGSGIMGNGMPYKAVPVDAFNNAVWNDVHKGLQSSQRNSYGTRSPYGGNKDTFHTPPAVGAAVTGLVEGVSQQYGGARLLSPRHFVTGLAGAGVDLATARVAGGVLGVLGGLTPQAQQKLQNMGMWGGFMRGVSKSVLGL